MLSHFGSDTMNLQCALCCAPWPMPASFTSVCLAGHWSVAMEVLFCLLQNAFRDIGLGGVDEEWLMWVLSSTLRPWLMVRQRTVVARPGTHAEL